MCTMLQVVDAEEQVILRNFNDALDGNISPSSGAVLDEVNTGTRLVGITNEGMARQRILEGEDLVMTYPTDGTSAIPDATAIVKGTKHLENAQLFWILRSVRMHSGWWRKPSCAEPSVMICRRKQQRRITV